MKHGGLILASIMTVFLFAFSPLIAQSSAVNYQTYMVDTFDEPEAQDWQYHAVGSKFVTEGYPKLKYFDGMPRAVRVMQEDPEKAKVLGLEVKFNRKGDNWVDIFPTKEGEDGRETYEIPFKGHIHRLELWVWGAGYYYDLEILVRDCEGRVHTLPLGLVSFKGWQNMHVTVPGNIPQSSKYLGHAKNLSFVAFRIRTRPGERVDQFKIFFDQFKALTDVHFDSFDGYELGDSDFNEEGEGNGEENKGKTSEESDTVEEL